VTSRSKGDAADLTDSGLSSTTDSTYYHFLLKLGTIRATTWTEKWRIYKSTHPSAFPLKHIPPPDTPTTRPLRARVPFLASASSDLDEGFATPSDHNEQYRHPTRPSPRKVVERSRSLVGYTPTPSLLDDDDESRFDTAEFDPPVRTSTPNRAYRRSESPDLPPYSISDVSEALMDEDDTSLLEGPSTPKAYTRDLKDRHVWESEEEQDGELERRADDFFATGLLGRCLDVWSHSATWIQACLSVMGTSHARS
jgi:protein SFI1